MIPDFREFLNEANNTSFVNTQENTLLFFKEKRRFLKSKIDKLKAKVDGKFGDEKQLVEFQILLYQRQLENLDLKEKIVKLSVRIKLKKENSDNPK